MNSSEKRTIISVLILYLSSTILIVFTLAFSYYKYQQDEIKTQVKNSMTQDAKKVLESLSYEHKNMENIISYPRFDQFNSAIYDIDKNLIFSTNQIKSIDLTQQFYQDDNFNYFIYEISPYYLGAAYIVIERANKTVLKRIGLKVVLLALFVVFILVITSLFLVKLILKPIRDNLNLLDRFIKDTTHELNTPVSTILTNIELLGNSDMDIKTTKKINRIKTASLTISNLYDDLVFLVLNHKLSSQNEICELNDIVKQRVEYFEVLFSSKDLKVEIKEKDICLVEIDKKRLIKVIDNLISNAIKYTEKSTTIEIIIDKNSFQIRDQGNGMSQDQIKKIFDRYTRFDNTQGGFGIGYNIIYTIVKEYNIDINIDSKLDEGTCVTLQFS
ncbi:MAG: HAMP domain-containing sensor histidine kinase [Campylobacterota bacterium]|nr:HAMP domain-containing sensor histidine kinase [Campylobacterota bacterium]